MNYGGTSRGRLSGFTIVELLIVIVVIAILATVSVVAYTGVTERSHLAQQTAALDRVGKAIQLYVAESGQSLGLSGTGYDGKGYGALLGTNTTGSAYAETSVDSPLRSKGYLTGSVAPLNDILLAPCTTTTHPRWVVLAKVTPAPSKSTVDQISETGCPNDLLNLYTTGGYQRNILKAY